MTTLRELLEEHPEWADLPVVVPNPELGEYDWLSGAALVYTDTVEEDGEVVRVLVFAPN